MRLSALIRAAAMAATLLSAQPAPAAPPEDFGSWLDAFRDRALAAGIGAGTLDAALPAITWLPEVVERDRNQFEFTRTIWDYLDRAVSEERITSGRRALAAQTSLFDEIETRFGVDRHIVAAIWGLESSYGAVRGDVPDVPAREPELQRERECEGGDERRGEQGRGHGVPGARRGERARCGTMCVRFYANSTCPKTTAG